jgi:hypothetical protein
MIHGDGSFGNLPLAYALGVRSRAGTLLLVVEELPLAGESTFVSNEPPYITAAPGPRAIVPSGYCMAQDSHQSANLPRQFPNWLLPGS